MVDRLLQMAGEPSTWRGVITILTALGITLAPAQAAAITAAGLALTGIINVFRKEQKPGDTTVNYVVGDK